MSNPYQRRRSSKSQAALPTQEEFYQQSYIDFLHQIVAINHVWGLASDHWALCSTSHGDKAMPIWSKQSSALMNCAKDWKDYEPHLISLRMLLEEILPQLVENNILVAMERTTTGEAIYVDPKMILEHIIPTE
ncbi:MULTISPECIES: DUF2750 domain-containing protein [unclassified Acinetobacter]|uniref:DUF2750 domain-containing protein n=1 Tax=unclassified Acinetobacter TaxID=196816 RepID=UPI0035B85FA0